MRCVICLPSTCVASDGLSGGWKGCGRMKSNLIEQVKTCGGKYAIALSANANKGKTAILKMFADTFRSDAAVAVLDMKPMGNNKDEMWCFLQDGVTIGIATGGDDADMIDKAFDFFKANGCNLVFCATRYNSDEPSWMEFLSRCGADGYSHDWQGVDSYSPETLDVMHLDIAKNVLREMLGVDKPDMRMSKATGENIGDKVMDFAKVLNDASKNGCVNSFTVTETRYRTDASTKETSKEKEVKYEVKCRDQWGRKEIVESVVGVMPYIAVIAISSILLCFLLREPKTNVVHNITTTFKTSVDQQ